MQGIFRKENTDKALKYGIYRHLPTYEKIIRNLVSFFEKNYEKQAFLYLELRRGWEGTITVMDGSRCMKVNGRDSKTLELRRVDRAVSNLLW